MLLNKEQSELINILVSYQSGYLKGERIDGDPINCVLFQEGTLSTQGLKLCF